MLSVVCFKWQPYPGYRSKFDSAHVNVLRAMVERHYHQPHRFICITDDPEGLDSRIEVVPLWDDFSNMASPHGRRYPSCYRRLKMFSPDIAQLVGERFVMLDLDCVIAGDLTELWDRPEDFVAWGGTNRTTHYNGSMMLMTAGARKQVWEDFDPATSPMKSVGAGQFGSDQGWISFKLGKGEAMWDTSDGVYSYMVHLNQRRELLPKNAKIVFFNGKIDPWSYEAQQLAWVRKYWC